MNACVFRLSDKKATLILSDECPAEQWRIETSPSATGTLLLCGKRFALTEGGARVCARELHSGVHAPIFLVNGERYEGCRIAVFGGTIYPLPPTKNELARLFERTDQLGDKVAALEERVLKLEKLLQTTKIF